MSRVWHCQNSSKVAISVSTSSSSGGYLCKWPGPDQANASAGQQMFEVQSMVWAIAILGLVLYTPLAEYAAHRWLMHYPGMGRGSWWREHAIEHHGKGRNDVNIDINALSVVAATSPMFVFAIFLGWAWVAFVLAACIGYAALWSS